jgi:hypothetical protein
MREAGLVVFAVIVGAWLLGAIVRLRSQRLGTLLQLSAAVVSRLVAATVFVWMAIWSVERGGAWLLLAVVCAVVALFSFAYSVLVLWVLISGQFGEDRPADA